MKPPSKRLDLSFYFEAAAEEVELSCVIWTLTIPNNVQSFSKHLALLQMIIRIVGKFAVCATGTKAVTVTAISHLT